MLWETLTGREHLQFYGRLKGLSGSSLDLVSSHIFTCISTACSLWFKYTPSVPHLKSLWQWFSMSAFTAPAMHLNRLSVHIHKDSVAPTQMPKRLLMRDRGSKVFYTFLSQISLTRPSLYKNAHHLCYDRRRIPTPSPTQWLEGQASRRGLHAQESFILDIY